MKISWNLLTFNRAELVEMCLQKNLEKMGHAASEIVWTDNGSSQKQMVEEIVKPYGIPLKKIQHETNLGVAKGYNACALNSSGDWILITGCDRLFQDNWLKLWVEAATIMSNTKCISVYAHSIDKLPERKRGEPFMANDRKLCKAMPFGARLVHKDLFALAGHLREDLGLYGFEDVIWSETAMKICEQKAWGYYAALDMQSRHIGDEGVKEYVGFDPHDYWRFKQAEVKDPRKMEVVNRCMKQGWPPYFPPGAERAT